MQAVFLGEADRPAYLTGNPGRAGPVAAVGSRFAAAATLADPKPDGRRWRCDVPLAMIPQGHP